MIISRLIQVAAIALGLGLGSLGLSLASSYENPDWPQFRYAPSRQGDQYHEKVLNRPDRVLTLHLGWPAPFHAAGGAFTSSPVVSEGKIYIGNTNGYFYAINAANGAQIWQYPGVGNPPLDSQFHCNPSSFGIASTAAITYINGIKAVIFGAPDQSSGANFGDGHLFALNADTGDKIWELPAVAQVTGLTAGATSELHEQIGYSAPLVYRGKVYIGVADHCDNPIQHGKVVAVDLATGNIIPWFNFLASPTRGGGVWSSVAGYKGLFLTTGNTRTAAPEPSPNYGLSLLRLDADTGSLIWQHQPVPFSMDNDPDWAAGATVTWTSCGTEIISTQKDGWTWAVDEKGPAPRARWAFPTGPWIHGGFQPADGTVHGDTDYKRPGAAWGDVYVGTMGGYDTVSNLTAGYTRLHALNICSSDAHRVRWIKDIPGTSGGPTYPLGPPTVTGGMFFVGTSEGHVVAVADPSIAPPVGLRCEDPDIPTPSCLFAGHRLVPDPWSHDVQLPKGSADAIFGEPVLVDGRVYVATWAGNVYMLQP